jgi:BirA family transcriptional regulator, biotin operon repressor / biotin---[acetyl-CoA-carboxylase] ligase
MAGSREWHPVIGSTQARAIELAQQGTPEGTVVVAARQTAGRGRVDHRWESPEGGLYLSVILAAPESPPTLLPLAVGLFLAEAIEQRYRITLVIKWPNDLLREEAERTRRKLAGVLVDRVATPRSGAAVVIGIGINVALDSTRYPAPLRDHVAAIAEGDAGAPDLAEVERLAIDAARNAISAVRDPDQIDFVRSGCRRRLFGVGRIARVDGREVGRIEGLADDGALLVDLRGERVAIRAGDLRVEDPP